jgi:hypothetical protein
MGVSSASMRVRGTSVGYLPDPFLLNGCYLRDRSCVVDASARPEGVFERGRGAPKITRRVRCL